MSPKTKKFLSNFFFGLFSNDHAIEGSKSNPWWVALIIGLVSVFIPVIPLSVAQANTYGASFLSNYTYRYDQNIVTLTKELALANKEFKVNNDHFLEYYDNGALVNYAKEEDDLTPIIGHVSTATNEYELLIYYSQRDRSGIQKMLDTVNKTYYTEGTTTVNTSEAGSMYLPSYTILFKEGIYTRINKENSTEVGNGTYTSYATDWKHFEVGFELIKGALPKDKTAATMDIYKDKDEVFNNWKEYYNKSYLSQKTYNVWMMSLVFLGIYAGLTIVMGLLIFLLTRGKNNMFNYLKFIDTLKIVWWATLSPAILAMIVGFIFSQFAQMAFIILLGLRVMWISMKQLRPQY